MKLEIKHLAPYLTYGLNVKIGKNRNYKVGSIHILHTQLLHDFTLRENAFMPILRPIQEVEQYFENLYGSLEHQDVTNYFDADFLESHDNIEIEEIQLLKPEQLPYGTLKVLLKHHFDVFDLISKGLAISIHDVERGVR